HRRHLRAARHADRAPGRRARRHPGHRPPPDALARPAHAVRDLPQGHARQAHRAAGRAAGLRRAPHRPPAPEPPRLQRRDRRRPLPRGLPQGVRLAAAMPPPWRSNLGLLVVGLGTLAAPLDAAVNIAFPSITQAFALDVEDIRWVVIAYVLTY